jgi:hypothetical protein
VWRRQVGLDRGTRWPAESSAGRMMARTADRGGAPDLSVSGDNFDLVGDDPHDPTTTSETRSANAIAEPTPNGY